MTGIDYAASQTAATWNMAWNRSGWKDQMDRSVDGVFRSFWAIAFAAPFAFARYLLFREIAAETPDFPESPLLQAPFAFGLTAEMIGYAANWAAGLVTLILFARAINAGERAAELIIGFNWLHVLTELIQLPPLAAFSIAGGRQIGALLAVPATALTVFLLYGYIRRALGAPLAQSIAVLLFLGLLVLVLSVLIDGGARIILHALS